MMAVLVGCKNEIISSDPGLKLTLSADTVLFDTVFTSIGSSTRRVMVTNTNAHAVVIDRVEQDVRQEFQVNINGETNLSSLAGTTLRGGDSLYIFVRVKIEPTHGADVITVEDNIRFHVNGNETVLHLQAYGEDMEMLSSKGHYQQLKNYTFTAEKPYLIFDTLDMSGTTTIEAGARLYFHQNAVLRIDGNLSAIGNEQHPILMMGDRRDYLFDNVPYSYASGQWGGVYIVEDEMLMTPRTYEMRYVTIISGITGLFAYSALPRAKSTLVVDHCRIHNHTTFGLVAQNIHSTVTNTEVSNAASYLVYLAGGQHKWDHTTVANYYNATNIRVQNVPLDKTLPVLTVDTAYDIDAKTELELTSSIVTGLNKRQIYCTWSEQTLDSFPTCYVAADTTKHLFRNTYYEYKVYDYYDFRLDSISPARGIGRDSTDAGAYPYK